MSETDNGGAAFPHPEYVEEYSGGARVYVAQPGMALRDYFAAKAMVAYIDHLSRTGQTVSKCYAEIAEESFHLSDAMLAARGSEAPR